jgi:hypothetical protein
VVVGAPSAWRCASPWRSAVAARSQPTRSALLPRSYYSITILVHPASASSRPSGARRRVSPSSTTIAPVTMTRHTVSPQSRTCSVPLQVHAATPCARSSCHRQTRAGCKAPGELDILDRPAQSGRPCRSGFG